MTIPTPSAIAKQATARKQLELQQQNEREAAIAALESKLDVASRSKSEKVRASRASHSSPKGKAPATSSRSAKSGSTKKTEPSSAGSEKTASQSPPSTSPKSAVKKTFVRKPHLTQRLSDNEVLKELQEKFPVKAPNRRSSSSFTKSKRSSTTRTEQGQGSSKPSKQKSPDTGATTQRRTERSSKQK